MIVKTEPTVDLDRMPSPTGAKTLLILELLSRNPLGLTAAEVTRQCEITGNLVFRILKTLVAMGFATQSHDNKSYVLSSRLLSLASPRVGKKSLVVASYEILRELRDETGETVQLVIAADGKALVLEQVQGTQPLQVCGQVGMRVPMHSCAPGKAILAWWDETQRTEWYHGRVLRRYTSTTLVRRKDLEQDLAVSRERGFSIDRSEGVEGIRCVAAPILDLQRLPLAAITVMAPSTRLPDERFEFVGLRCQAAAKRIELQLGS